MKSWFVALLVWPSPAIPHGGGLDGHGCHHNRKQGGYHCHQGEHAGESFASQAEMLGGAGAQSPYRAIAPTAGGACGSKTYCTQMTSCEEAIYFLTQCGLSRLDGDNDGKPCESLCR